ncbi:MAG: hypothetical protein LBT46_05795 [Planctomycetaceae bacterium]|jgi:hypothetical protein|nr:hypothetical protein [Planctomycetaceae bacterium]
MFRTFITALCCLTVFALSVLLAQRAEEPPQPGQTTTSPAVQPAEAKPRIKTKRQREGTAMSGEKVFFRQNGNRTVLYRLKDNQRLTCLENLTLERVLGAMEKKPEHKYWRIDGTLTEFRGENYIIIHRAVVTTEKTDGE